MVLTTSWCKNACSLHTQSSSRHVEVGFFQASQFQALGYRVITLPGPVLELPCIACDALLIAPMVSILLQGRKQHFVSENVSIDSFLANHISTQMGHTSMKIVMSCQVIFIGKKRIDEYIM
jgi:hypothetical protein